jgi:hypothetical protein
LTSRGNCDVLVDGEGWPVEILAAPLRGEILECWFIDGIPFCQVDILDVHSRVVWTWTCNLKPDPIVKTIKTYNYAQAKFMDCPIDDVNFIWNSPHKLSGGLLSEKPKSTK